MGAVAVKDRHQHGVQLQALEEHPEEGGEEEVVQGNGYQAAEQLDARFVDSEQKDRLRDEEAGAEVLVDGVAD